MIKITKQKKRKRNNKNNNSRGEIDTRWQI